MLRASFEEGGEWSIYSGLQRLTFEAMILVDPIACLHIKKGRLSSRPFLIVEFTCTYSDIPSNFSRNE